MSDHTTFSDLNLFKGLDTYANRIKKEREQRLENASRRLSFGVSFLDETLGGIYPNDLVLLGAKTGYGKTQLSTLIALHNAKRGKRVHYFALESEEYEIERRIKYQLLTQRFYRLDHRPMIKLNYMDWHYGAFDNYVKDLEIEIENESSQIGDLKIFYRNLDFNVKEFERLFLAIKDETDLVIIDHLHYFDYDDDNENRAVKTIVKKIRDCVVITGKPVLLIAHMRKMDRRNGRLIPDLDDFHGSSDIGKIATKAVTLAPCFDSEDIKIRKTYMKALKCRVDGSRMNYVGLLVYNLTTQQYEMNYYFGKLQKEDTEFIALSKSDIPFWALNAITV